MYCGRNNVTLLSQYAIIAGLSGLRLASHMIMSMQWEIALPSYCFRVARTYSCINLLEILATPHNAQVQTAPKGETP